MPARPLDPRLFQIATLGALLMVNLTAIDMGASPLQALVTITAALTAQAGFGWLRDRRLVRGDLLSSLITGLSLSLLLRTHVAALWVLAPMIGIGAKFVLRVAAKHLFNPANIAIVTLLLVARDQVWVSPGQWGQAVWFAFALVSAGALVLNRSARADTAIAFALSFGGLLVARCLILGDPLTIPVHQMESGSLLIFTGFMITDPRSTPDARLGRVIFAASVALIAYWLAFTWQLREALFYALAAACPLTPLLDRLLAAPRFTWAAPRPSALEGASP